MKRIDYQGGLKAVIDCMANPLSIRTLQYHACLLDVEIKRLYEVPRVLGPFLRLSSGSLVAISPDPCLWMSFNVSIFQARILKASPSSAQKASRAAPGPAEGSGERPADAPRSERGASEFGWTERPRHHSTRIGCGEVGAKGAMGMWGPSGLHPN